MMFRIASALVALSAAGSFAAVGAFHRDAADTTLHVVNTVNAKAIVADAGMGTGIEATGDLAIQANGSRVGLRAEAEYYGIEAVARNGVGVRAMASGTGVSAEGGSTGLSAGGGGAGVSAAAFEPGGVGVKGAVEHPRGVGVWGQAGVYGAASPAAIGVAGYGMGDGSVGVSGIVDGQAGVAVLGTATGAGGHAGFFRGGVVITGVCNPCVPADSALQSRPRAVEGALAKVMALKPRTYEALVVHEVGAGNGGDPSESSAGRRYGFSAQEARAVVPEVVREVTAPAPRSPAEQWNTLERGPETLAVINYAELVPLLVRAIQEQQAEIEALKRAAGRKR
jgi:hypothetical protein